MSIEAAFRAAGVPAARARAEAPHAAAAMLEFGVTTQARAAMFTAQVLHESVLLAFFEEIASGAAYEGRTDLGNTHVGDGRRYKGRGPIQLTGRGNYRAAGAALGLDLEGHPEMASDHAVGWRIAGWYWKTRGLSALADAGNFRAVTVRINGAATEGAPTYYARRRELLALVQRVDCRPVDKWAGYTAAELRWMHEFDHLHAHGLDEGRQRVLVRVMTAQRKRVWQAAEHDPKGREHGWVTANRRARYRSLMARTS